MRSRVFGLNLHADRLIPGLVESAAFPTDVRIRLGCLPEAFADWERAVEQGPVWYVSPDCDTAGRPLLTVHRSMQGGFFAFRYADGTCFVLDRAGSEIWVTWQEPLTLADAATYLLGPVLGFVLRLRGRVCLHASTVVIDGQAVALLGPAGAGKSTTAAAFAQRGFPVLGDDVAALAEGSEGFLVPPAYPQLRLWPSSVAILYGDATALPPLTPNWDKCGLDLAAAPLSDQALPLGAVYLLGERRAVAEAPYVEAVSPAEALMTLVTHTYTNYLLDRAARAAEFAALSRLVAGVPVRRVVPHADAGRLPQLCDVLVNDYQIQNPHWKIRSPKSEIRNPKSETNTNPQPDAPKPAPED